MEQDNMMANSLKKNRMIVVIGIVVVGLVIAIAGVVAINMNSPFRTSDNDSTLSNQLESEKAGIADAFNGRFKFLHDQYRINKIALVGQGEYAIVLLELESASYRAILRKEDNGWIVVGVPAVVLYYEDFPEVPEEVVRVANDMKGESDE